MHFHDIGPSICCVISREEMHQEFPIRHFYLPFCAKITKMRIVFAQNLFVWKKVVSLAYLKRISRKLHSIKL
jgi:hypothetical protein